MYYSYNDRKTTLLHRSPVLESLSTMFERFMCFKVVHYSASSLFSLLSFFFKEQDAMCLNCNECSVIRKSGVLNPLKPSGFFTYRLVQKFYMVLALR